MIEYFVSFVATFRFLFYDERDFALGTFSQDSKRKCFFGPEVVLTQGGVVVGRSGGRVD